MKSADQSHCVLSCLTIVSQLSMLFHGLWLAPVGAELLSRTPQPGGAQPLGYSSMDLLDRQLRRSLPCSCFKLVAL